VRGLAFGDEAAAVNAVVPELRRQGVEAIVVLLHEGGFLRTDARADDDCEGFQGPAARIVGRLDPAVDVVVSGHTHRAYRCRISGRLVTSAASYGRLVTAIDLTIDRATRDVVRSEAANIVVDPARYPADPAVARFVAEVVDRAKVPAQRPAGRLGAPVTTAANAAGESSLGTLVAEAHLAAFRETGRADIAFTNPGGLRSPIRPRDASGTVTYGDLFAAQPFSNVLVAVTLSGAEILALLERQFHKAPERSRILQVAGLDYAWDGRVFWLNATLRKQTQLRLQFAAH
jgi:5'-nucleotidase